MASCSKGQFNIVGHLEKGFYHFGYLVARRPWTVIFISLLITSICSLGFLNLKFETDANKIWGPDTSAYTTNNKWLSENFPQNKRVQTIIFQSDEEDRNILSPKSLKRMINLHKQIADLAPQNSTFESICHR
jgi:predicted RND superfamily exporter protein